LSEFLLRSHAGFCQQFATSMAVLARIDGIPSRVAVGFTQGNRQRDGSWTITSHDAHAWPELYFSGFGWLAFEPTPRADGQAVAPAYTLPHTSTKPTGNNQGSSKAGSAPHQSTSIPSLSKLQHLDQADDQRGRLGRVIAAHRSGASIRARVATGFGVLLLLLAAFPWVLRRLTRRRRWRGATTVRAHASAAWSELAATLVDYGIDWPHGLSPRAAARIVQVEAGELDPVAQLSLDQIVATVERAWYAAPDATAADDLRPDVELIRRTLSARLRWPRRVVLGLWPRSALHDTRAGLARLAGWLDAADLAGARLRARLTGS
jgi:hypothetical protein